MEERQHGVDDLLAVLEAGHPRAPLRGVGPQVAVREHRALRHAGRAAGVLQQREVGRDRPRVVGRQRCGTPDQRVPRERAGGRPGHRGARRAGLRDRQPQHPLLPARQRRGEVDRDDRAHLRSCARPAGCVGTTLSQAIATVAPWSAELVLELLGGVERVVLDHDGTEPQHGVERDDVLRAVRHDERHPVACGDAEVDERLRRARHLVAELAVGRLAAVEVERDVVREAPHGGVEQVAERLVRGVDVRGDAGGVLGQPGTGLVVRHVDLSQQVAPTFARPPVRRLRGQPGRHRRGSSGSRTVWARHGDTDGMSVRAEP